MDHQARGTAADAISAAFLNADAARAYCTAVQLADDLAASSRDERVALAATPPTALPRGWDAFLAAIVDWRLQQVDFEPPAWVADSRGDPQHSWTPPDAVLTTRADRIPPALLQRGVRVEAAEFDSA